VRNNKERSGERKSERERESAEKDGEADIKTRVERQNDDTRQLRIN